MTNWANNMHLRDIVYIILWVVYKIIMKILELLSPEKSFRLGSRKLPYGAAP